MKQSRASRAEQALQRAIDEATSDLRTQIREKDSFIAQLQATLSRIVQIAGGVPQVTNAVAAPPPPLPPMPQEVEIPQGPAVELNPGDTLGEGRWV